MVYEFQGKKARVLSENPSRRQAVISTYDKERQMGCRKIIRIFVSFVRLPPVDCVIKRVLPAKCKVYNIVGRPIRA